MRVYRFDRFDGLHGLTLHDEPTPKPQRGEVLVKVRAVSLNYRDIAIPSSPNRTHLLSVEL
jgi:NADPH:quinone reductase-like Zn-dependent oxidoreductase